MEKRNQRKRPQTPHLSCELCRERKIKCDKVDPCTNCVSAGVVCVPVHRPRLPRGVHARRARRMSPAPAPAPAPTPAAGPVSPKEPQMYASSSAVAAVDEDLRKRIHRLEALVNSMRSATTSPCLASLSQSGINNSHPAPTGSLSCSPSAPGVQKQAPLTPGSDCFWTNLTGEGVDQIQELDWKIGSTSEHTKADSHSPPTPNASKMDGGGLRVLGLSGNNPALAWTPLLEDKEMTRQLCQVYLQQVDPIIKILHRPSVEKWIMQGERYLGFPERHVAVDALGSAICYAAAASLTDDQCPAHFQSSKSSGIVADCRRACEAALERSGLLASPSITVLQAFVLYLIARRSEDRSQAAWTLTAVAVRLAKALGLHMEPDETFFSQQMRRRLWLTISLMDLQASFSQASEPLINTEEAISTFVLPRHINDSDFDPTTAHDIPDREGLCDTTFALVTYHIQLAGRALNFSAAASAQGKASQQQHAQHFERNALRLLHFCDPESSPYAWFTWHGTQCLVSGARLSALRPLQRLQPCSGSSQPSPSPPPCLQEHNAELLRLAVNVLEKAHLMHTDLRGEGFRWYVTIPWHALAVAITECSLCPDVTQTRCAWPTIEACYQLLRREGMAGQEEAIQRPLEKLIRRARETASPLLQLASPSPTFGFSSSAVTSAAPTPQSRSSTAPSDSLSDLSWPTAFSHSHSQSHLGLDLAPACPVQPLTKLDLDPMLLPFDMEGQPLLAGQMPRVDVEPSLRTWEQLMSEIDQAESAGSNIVLYTLPTHAMALRMPFNQAFWEEYLSGQDATLPSLPDTSTLSSRVIRILGGNPGAMHLQGTNTYLVGTGQSRILIDTGQGLPIWLTRVTELLHSHDLSISHILLTHWHGDHTGGVPGLVSYNPALAEHVYKNLPDADQKPIADGQIFAVQGATVRAIFTPGHSVDHMCFLLEEENALFTGDNVLGHGYSVAPDLGRYMESLERMAGLGCGLGYPAHGAVIDDLPGKLEEYIRHKETRVRGALS
ncbi:Zn(II)2Cys6 domain-containing transcription factor nscR, partial [Aspergillus thermomutatus]